MVEIKNINRKSFPATNTFRSAASITVLVLCLSVAHGEDLTTLDKKAYTNISWVNIYPSQVFFDCNEKRTFVATTNLPAEFLVKYYGIINSTSSNPTDWIQTVDQINSSLTNAVDLFLLQHKDTDLMECDNIFLKEYAKARSLQLCLNGIDVDLTSYGRYTNTMRFQIGQEALINQVFDKCIKWDGIAETKWDGFVITNKTESFKKVIASCIDANETNRMHTYTFCWDSGFGGGSTLEDSGTKCTALLDKDDVIQFQKLLNKLPTVKDKLAQKIRNKETQKDLFK